MVLKEFVGLMPPLDMFLDGPLTGKSNSMKGMMPLLNVLTGLDAEVSLKIVVINLHLDKDQVWLLMLILEKLLGLLLPVPITALIWPKRINILEDGHLLDKDNSLI